MLKLTKLEKMHSKNSTKLGPGSASVLFHLLSIMMVVFIRQFDELTLFYSFSFFFFFDEQIMENIESQMQAFEESAESNKLEIQENEKKLADFQGQIEKDRNEGLFFKNLKQKTPSEKEKGKAKAKEEMEKLKELTKENAESKARRNIYLALIGLVVIGISDVLISSSSDWRKAAVLGIILVGLLSQLFYEQRMLSETERQKKIEENKSHK